MRLRTVVLAVGLLSLACVLPTLATEDCGAQNPTLTVCGGLISSGKDPDNATIGDFVLIYGAITNNSFLPQVVTVTIVLTPPDGEPITLFQGPLFVPAGQTVIGEEIIQIDENFPPGDYFLTGSATGVIGGTSSATAYMLVY